MITSNVSVAHKYAYARNEDGRYIIKSCFFDNTIPLDKAVSEISSDKKVIRILSCYKYYVMKTLGQIQEDLSNSKKLKNLKVNGMIDFGQTAFVFETNDGDILKITSRDHFLGRQPQNFDLSVKEYDEAFPKSFCHYYVEEKISKDVASKDLYSLVEKIKKQGYKIVDFRSEQFGKTKDGKVVLIDPECARKSGLLGLFKYKLEKIKSYLRIIAK